MASGDEMTGIEFASDLLRAIHAHRTDDFVGLGIVLYKPPLDFDAVPLGGWLSARPPLPVVGAKEISEALGELSRRSSIWHDGFHFIESTTPALTHVSQFLAPDLSQIRQSKPSELPTGARQLTAMLISRLPCVGCVALLTTNDQLTIYREGRLHLRTPANHA